MANQSIGTAYINISPSSEGISGSIKKMFNGEGEDAGNSIASKLVSTLKKGLSAVAVAGTVKQMLSFGGELQQSLGGIETLYKDSANIMIENASKAFESAGLSANDYMETATSFAASLLQGVAGDTEKAAQITDMAIRDMSDNANKFGTDMSLIQNAYQGFAKQNFTMLDNLKLGYGGTKTEMERLLKDAQKISGIKYDISNFADISEAINVIQNEMGVTGTTSLEASKTFSGSLSSMKAAAENLMAYMTTGQDITPALSNLVSTVSTFIFNNLLPMLANIVKALPSTIVTALSSLPQLLANIVKALPSTIVTALSSLSQLISDWFAQMQKPMLNGGIELIGNLINGIVETLPNVIVALSNLVMEMVNHLMANLPTFLEQGVSMIMSVIGGISQATPNILGTLLDLVIQLASTILQNLPTFIACGVDLVISIINGLISMAGDLLSNMWDLIVQAKDKIFEIDWLQTGKDIISGIISGVGKMASALIDAVVGVAKKAWEAAKNFLGINSPSRLFAELGVYTDEGFAIGVLDSVKVMTDATKKAAQMSTKSFENEISLNATRSNTYVAEPIKQNAINSGFTQNNYISSPTQLSPSEVARQTKIQTRKMALSLSLGV